jgi:hypothetical protein
MGYVVKSEEQDAPHPALGGLMDFTIAVSGFLVLAAFHLL